MLKHRTQPAAYVTPEFRSAEWIAHNATMREKRRLLSGEKPVIGCAYQPRIVPTPAITAYRDPARISLRERITSVACLAALVGFLGFVMFAGSAAGF